MTRSPDHNASAVESELAALGEASLAPEEEGLVSRSNGEAPAEQRMVEALIELSMAPPEEDLSQLERFRIWRKVEASRPTVAAREERPASVPPHRWRSVVAGLAVAAGVALWVRGQPVERETASDSAAVKELAEEARRGLAALGGSTGTKRARMLARTYARRLEVQK